MFSLLLFIGVAHAQEEMTLVADVSIENASVVYQEAGMTELFFEFVNGSLYQPDVRYGVQVWGDTQLLDEYVVPETISLSPDERHPQYISYVPPVWMDGTYTVSVVSFNPEGLPLAIFPIEDVSFEGTGEYLEIINDSCVFTADGESFSELEPVVIGEGQEAAFHCTVVSHFTEATYASPVSLVYRDSTFGTGVGAFPENRPVSFEPNEEKEVYFAVPVQRNGIFEHTVFFEHDGASVSNQVFYAYNTEMPTAQVINVSTNKDSYDRGDEIQVHTFVQGTNMDRVQVAVTSSTGRSCTDGVLEQIIMEEQVQVTATGTITKSCDGVIVTATVLDAEGVVLDTQTFGTSTEEVREVSALKIVAAVAVFIVLIVILYVMFRYRKNVGMTALFLGVLCVGGLMNAQSVEAKTWSSTSGNLGYSLTGTLNASSYNEGGSIGVSGYAYAYGTGSGAHGGGYTSVSVSTSGSSVNLGTRSNGGPIPSGTLTAPSSAGRYRATFSAYGISGSISYRVVSATPPAPTVSLAASPRSITSGDTTRLTWSSTNASSCSGSGSGFSTGGSTSGGDNASPTSDTRYTATCTGGGGSASASVDVSVSAPTPTASIAAQPSTVVQGGQTRLTWSSTNASYCTGVRFATSRRTSGSVYVTVSGDTTYGVRCYNADGDVKLATVRVTTTAPAPTVSLSLSPSTITEGGSATLTWSSSNTSTCSGSGSGFSTGGRTSGTDRVSPSSTTTYSITCTGTGGSDSDTARLTVNVPAPTANLSAASANITRGDSTTLTWSSTNASSCSGSGSGFSTGGRTSGTDSIAPTSSVTYTVTCSGSGGSDSDSVRVTVNTPTPPPNATLQVRNDTQGTSWTAANITITPGDQISLRWSSTNASSCNGGNFSTGGAANGTESSISEPSAGDQTTYSVSCVGSGGSDSDSLRVTAQAVDPSLSAASSRVREGESVSISYNMNGNDPAQCSFTGPGVSYLAGSFSNQTGSIQTAVSGDSTFTMTCSGGSAEVSVEIIPVVFDS